jgi:hypothetical protein
MTQVLTERLNRRAQQLNDAQAEKALAFIEFLLAQERLEKERYEWHTALQKKPLHVSGIMSRMPFMTIGGSYVVYQIPTNP